MRPQRLPVLLSYSEQVTHARIKVVGCNKKGEIKFVPIKSLQKFSIGQKLVKDKLYQYSTESGNITPVLIETFASKLLILKISY